MSRNNCGLLAIVVAGLLSGNAWAGSITADIGGIGTASGDVWCAPNAPPAASTAHSDSAGFQPFVFLHSIAGCSLPTNGNLSGDTFWRADLVAVAAGGDTVDGSDLLALVTATSFLATTLAHVHGDALDSTTVLFTYTWSGSDAGTAARLSIFDGGDLLDQITKVGPWNEVGVQRLYTVSDLSNVTIELDGMSTSLGAPEPSLVGLTLLALCGLSLAKRRSDGTLNARADLGLEQRWTNGGNGSR